MSGAVSAGATVATVQSTLEISGTLAAQTRVGVKPKTPGRLERVLVVERKLSDAIVVLERLSKLEPKRAREYYQRMAGYAAELYQDDRALSYAARAGVIEPLAKAGQLRIVVATMGLAALLTAIITVNGAVAALLRELFDLDVPLATQANAVPEIGGNA